jgi:Flp pilus assembly protein TadG
VLPLLVLLLMGIIEFSRAYNAKETMQYAAREGARTLSIKADAGAAQAVTVDRLAALPNSAAAAVATTPCPSTVTSPTQKATVTVTYPLDYNIPLFDSGTWTLSATASMRCNG